MSSRRAVLSIVVGLLLLPATASAAPDWVAPFNFPVPASDTSIGGLPSPNQILYQNGGIATEAFVQIVSYPAPFQTVLHIGTMAPGGSYADQLTIPSSEGAIPAGVQIAVAPSGAAVATWAELTGNELEKSPYRFRAAYRPAGSSTWEAPFTIATETEREKTSPRLSRRRSARAGRPPSGSSALLMASRRAQTNAPTIASMSPCIRSEDRGRPPNGSAPWPSRPRTSRSRSTDLVT